jgi:hypothetical protein
MYFSMLYANRIEMYKGKNKTQRQLGGGSPRTRRQSRSQSPVRSPLSQNRERSHSPSPAITIPINRIVLTNPIREAIHDNYREFIIREYGLTREKAGELANCMTDTMLKDFKRLPNSSKSHGFRLPRMGNQQPLDLPIEVRPILSKGETYYGIQDGRHRFVKRILRGYTEIDAIVKG